MAIAYVQSKGTTGSGNSTSRVAAFTAATTAGNHLVAIIVQGGSSALTLPSGWTSAVSQVGANQTVTLAYQENTPGGQTSFTFTQATGNGFTVILTEWSGIATASSLDQTASINDTTADTTLLTGTTATTTQADELWIGGIGCGNGTPSAPTNGFTLDVNLITGGAPTNKADATDLYLIASSTGTAGSGVTNSASVKSCGVIATFKAAGSGTTPIGPVTDSASGSESIALNIAAPAADSSSGTEALPVAILPTLAEAASGSEALAVPHQILSDAANGTEVATITIAAPLPSETASGTEAVAVVFQLPLADSATGADSFLAAVAAGLTDAGTGSNTSQPTALIRGTLADAATGSETLQVAVQLPPLPDTAVGSDGLTVFISQPIGPVLDAASGTDILSNLNVNVNVTDVASGTSLQTFTIAAPLLDNAVGSDLAAVQVAVTITDSATGAETVAIPLIQPTALDSAVGGDSLTATIQALITDTGAGSETITLNGNQSVVLTDSASGSEQTQLTATAPVADSATGGQLINGTLQTPLNDAALGSTAMTALLRPVILDNATGQDALTGKLALTLLDSATGAELQSVTYILSISDTASGSDLAAVDKTVNLVTLAATDSATGQDVVSTVKGYFIFAADVLGPDESITAKHDSPLADWTITPPNLTIAGPTTAATSWRGAEVTTYDDLP